MLHRILKFKLKYYLYVIIPLIIIEIIIHLFIMLGFFILVMSLEMKNLFTRFSNDAIASAAFGIEVNSLENPTNEFFLMGKDMINFTSVFKIAKFVFFQICPKIFTVSIIN